MAEEHHHHHHHHHHKMDGASKFKYQQLKSIQRRRWLEKYSMRALLILAAVMVTAVIVCYTFL